MNLNETYGKIEDMLEDEEHAKESIQARQSRREDIQKEIRVLSGHITKLNNRFQRLPELPPTYIVEWAGAVLQMPNLAFVVLDTTSVDDDADIIRVFIAGSFGQVLFDQVVHPLRYLNANSAYTGLTAEQLIDAHPLDEYWTHIRSVLAGRYVLAYNLTFVRNRLDENAGHYGLPSIYLIGEDLQDKARNYWSTYYSPKLTGICERIGLTLPTPATAPDRVGGQLALLRAMSQGIMDVAPAPEEADPLGDLEDSPF
jgi:hypothetical protein